MCVSGFLYRLSRLSVQSKLAFRLVSYLYLTIVLTVLPSAIVIVLRFVGDLFINTTLAPPVDLYIMPSKCDPRLLCILIPTCISELTKYLFIALM
ncbi:hypothetical protein PILCRDRAFT_607126 [Piloderma croceum F 1598]|uniref:Uncharacterized protein n=1 Tax=Piloderma croceum (strain F 1598) TaxID=765440 RepID=A0A0C3FDK9_PILCF|nr:hypothetical protein PILCRDRAFT_607126 [Piloderma croceum F 1598]